MWQAIFRAEPLAFNTLLIAGAVSAVAGWEWGVALLAAAVVGRVVVHVAAGIGEYRRVMAREWPRVRPLDHDDDW